MLLTAFGAFLGALLSILASIYIEFKRKPKLHLEIEDPPSDRTFSPPQPRNARFVRVQLCNDPMPRPLRWLGREAAMHCNGHIQFHHFADGAPVFSKPMPIRWAGSDEPLSFYPMPSGPPVSMLDQAKYNAAFYRNCYPGTSEPIDVAARFDDDEECYGWSNESYRRGKGWRNPDWRLQKERYLVTVTVLSSGETVSSVFQLENSVGRLDFRLMPASDEDRDRVAQ